MGERRINVLLVDDDEDDYILTRELLEESVHGQFDLKWAQSSASALAMQEGAQEDFDVYLLDYRLGGQTGVDLMTALIQKGCKAPIIIITGKGDEQIAVEALKAGASDYLIKGNLTSSSLYRAILNALQKASLKRTIEDQHENLLEAERQRVMIESVGAAFFRFSQPLTGMVWGLQMLVESEDMEKRDRRDILQNCLEAATTMQDLVKRFQEAKDVRTSAYVDDVALLDANISSLENYSTD